MAGAPPPVGAPLVSGEAPRILLVDDDPLARGFAAETLIRRGYRLTTCQDGVEALHNVRQALYDALVLDLRMPGLDGMQVLEEVRRNHPDVEVVVATAFASIESAVEAVKGGAFDYVTKPFSAERLALAVERAVERRRIRQETIALRRR